MTDEKKYNGFAFHKVYTFDQARIVDIDDNVKAVPSHGSFSICPSVEMTSMPTSATMVLSKAYKNVDPVIAKTTRTHLKILLV
jgi:hypothetical protein